MRNLGRAILTTVAPEIGEAQEAHLLDREEQAAQAAARLTLTDDGHGKTYLRATLPTLQATMLKKALMAIGAPRHQCAVVGVVPARRTGPERMGKAFLEHLESYPVDRLPRAGGVAATVVVTMSLEALMGGLSAAHLDTGQWISPDLARKLACEAGIIPVVLDGDSVPLDVGRKARFHTQPQRVAVATRDKTCTAHGCDWPPGLCHVHHTTPWTQGGGTSVKEGRLLCPRHHARAHDPSYTITHLPGGKVAFNRRT
ncbi:DUF222 domain-containing protein [Nocardioides sp.]|uniref:HNH endonuclease signature motif containing protein n=1 Tax=Nocardioides sp. TaxID=35761 RepID=UPI0031FE938E|nr:nuclease [Nocardioides sp.]